jgi:D-serine deaminase-like pyridoxal phosphate-dependent protein
VIASRGPGTHAWEVHRSKLLAICGVGKRDFPADYLLPEPVVRHSSGCIEEAPKRWQVRSLMDHHTMLDVSGPGEPHVNEWIGFGINHPCTTFGPLAAHCLG